MKKEKKSLRHRRRTSFDLPFHPLPESYSHAFAYLVIKPNASYLVSFYHRILPQWITITKKTDRQSINRRIDNTGKAKNVCCCDHYNNGKSS